MRLVAKTLVLAIVLTSLGCAGGGGGNAPALVFGLSQTSHVLAPGGNATIDLSLQTNPGGAAKFTVANLPEGVTAGFTPSNTVTSGSACSLSLTAAPNAPDSAATIRIIGKDALGGTSEQEALVTVSSSGNAPSFSLEIEPTDRTLGYDGSTLCSFIVRPLNGFAGTVQVQVASGPNFPIRNQTDASVVLNDLAGAGGSFIASNALVAPQTGSQTVTVTATSGAITRTGTIKLHM